MKVYQELRCEILASLWEYENYYRSTNTSMPDERIKNIADVKMIINRHDKSRLAEDLRLEVEAYVSDLTYRFVRWVPGFSVTHFQSSLFKVLYLPKNCTEQLNIRLRDEYRQCLHERTVRANAIVEKRCQTLKSTLDKTQYQLDKANQEIDRLNTENQFLTEQFGEVVELMSTSFSGLSEERNDHYAQCASTFFNKGSKVSCQRNKTVVPSMSGASH